MMRNHRNILRLGLSGLLTGLLAATLLAGAGESSVDLNDLTEQAIKQAVQKVAPCVVQIQTQGGTDLIVRGPQGPKLRKALGPTTGLILSRDGYIISSAFNFLNQPKTILVGVPGHKEPYLARQLATDHSRMLTLLKIEAHDLPVPEVAPKKELRVGQWAIALGRTLDLHRDHPPSVSVGILSALGRIWGKAIQTDAKVSPVNYGGPLIDIRGRVQGILIPASPQSEDETAGFEWYDSGIGFAIPLEDVLAVLPRLAAGKDLYKGMLGVRFQSPNIYSSPPVVAAVTPNSPAAQAGLKAGDRITALDGQPVARLAQLMHLLGPKYAGETISLQYERGGKKIEVARLELVGGATAYIPPYLGILPLRDDPRLGVEIRYVFPGSPADRAGLRAGDRIVKYGRGHLLVSFQGQQRGRSELAAFLSQLLPGEEITLEVVRASKGKAESKTERVTLVLGALTGEDKGGGAWVPEHLPQPASYKQALAPLEVPAGKPRPPQPPAPPKGQTGLVLHKTPEGRAYYVYVPENYDPQIAHAPVFWLHPPREGKPSKLEEFADTWDTYCADYHLLLLCPVTNNEAGWNPGDLDYLLDVYRDAQGRYTLDGQRVVAHGLGVGGQMALYLGFHARDLVRGVAACGAVVSTVPENLPTQRLAFFLVAGGRDPLLPAITESREKLRRRGYPVVYREAPALGRQYPDTDILDELARWIDALDRL
jgi:serine protease Do